jgi:mono/diheme cytochrome c family protein
VKNCRLYSKALKGRHTSYRLLFFCFIITTTVGAMTGVGIWFAASLVNPYSIGSLLRVFFWGWFAEWLVFVTEVCLILAYFLTWKTWTGPRKARHNAIGWALGVFSWVTMALIVAVLAFMMNTGDWGNKPSFWTAFLNPLYFPQLSFRTPLAMVSAGLLGMSLVRWFTKDMPGFRPDALRMMGQWVLAWLPLLTFGAWWYWTSVPRAMTGNLSVALTTMQFTRWHEHLLTGATWAVGFILLACLLAWLRPRWMPTSLALIPFALSLMLLGYFERVREFIRKPYVIPGYMYSNAYRVEDYPLLQRDGVLKHAIFVDTSAVTPQNRVDAGRNVFLLTCSRCHTTDGMNGVVRKFQAMYGTGHWDETAVATYVGTMHGARPFMPPFPGNQAELEALAAYIVRLPENPEPALGAQRVGANAVFTRSDASKLLAGPQETSSRR